MQQLTRPDDSPVRVLVVDDEVNIAELLATALRFVTKPFSLEEVVARLRGLIRRGGTAARADAGNVLVVGDLTLDEDSHEVHRSGEEIRLTATEFELLRFLMRNPRRRRHDRHGHPAPPLTGHFVPVRRADRALRARVAQRSARSVRLTGTKCPVT